MVAVHIHRFQFLFQCQTNLSMDHNYKLKMRCIIERNRIAFNYALSDPAVNDSLGSTNDRRGNDAVPLSLSKAYSNHNTLEKKQKYDARIIVYQHSNMSNNAADSIHFGSNCAVVGRRLHRILCKITRLTTESILKTRKLYHFRLLSHEIRTTTLTVQYCMRLAGFTTFKSVITIALHNK
jgi:hypothetical protein